MVLKKKGMIGAEHKTLTDREVEVLKLIVGELTSAEIAEQLGISIRTVETHRKNITHKTNVRSSVGLAKYAIRSGYIKNYYYRKRYA